METRRFGRHRNLCFLRIFVRRSGFNSIFLSMEHAMSSAQAAGYNYRIVRWFAIMSVIYGVVVLVVSVSCLLLLLC